MIELREVPLFSEIPTDELQRFEPMLRERKYKKNHVFMFENDQSDSIYILRTGKVKVYRIQDGKEIVIGIHFPGDVVGEAEALTGDLYRVASVETLEPVVAWQISKPDFLAIVDRYPSVIRIAYTMMFARVRVLNRTIRYLTFLDVRTKLANLMLDLYYNVGKLENGECKIDMKVNHALLASMVGNTRESISKTLSEFQSEGLIEIRQKYIFLRDMKRLEKICYETEEVPELRKWDHGLRITEDLS
ncbi:cAMP-binding protein [Paenibacillus selenitireducens]|uniref:cAMP-binding protein n=1 Tax=Paenibacillus selenitireducens TaxID=1324314 RepID=A0A1T2X5M2_9BACL|nr:Crp/Fnr family transcriptional regulator [Paenibacillus selenitireducens]OPA75169.1 cAMP-binding protein [Paenibacillus selenitireducens]